MARDYDKAAAAYKAALELNSGDHNVWGNLGNCYYMQKSKKQLSMDAYRNAIKEAEKRRSVNPNDPVLIASLAEYYALVGDTINSRQSAAKALDLGSENTEVIVRVMFAMEKSGNRSRAIHFLKMALDLGFPSNELIAYPGLEELIADPNVQELL